MIKSIAKGGKASMIYNQIPGGTTGGVISSEEEEDDDDIEEEDDDLNLEDKRLL
jgi:hypothetical protein